MADNGILLVEIAGVTTAFVGHAGNQFCDIWVDTKTGQSVALRFSLETAEMFLTKLSDAAKKLRERTHN